MRVRILLGVLLGWASSARGADLTVLFADPGEVNGVASNTVAGVTVVVDLVAGGSNAVLDGNTLGIGVNSDLDSGAASAQRRVDGTLAVPETITMTLSGFTNALPLTGFLLGSMGNNETVTFSSPAFDGAMGITGNGYSFDDAKDTISYNKTLGDGLTDVVFPGDPILVQAGDEIVFSTSLTVGGGVLLDEIRLEVAAIDLSTTVLSAMPTNALILNTNDLSSVNTLIESGNRKAQPFSLGAETMVTGFVFQVDESAASTNLAGTYSLEVFPVMDNLPWLAPVASLQGAFPVGLGTGDVFQVILSNPLDLKRGSYAVSLSTDEASIRLAVTGNNRYPHGVLIRNNSTTGNQWQLGQDNENDLAFAVLGSQSAIGSPSTAPNIVLILADDLGWSDIQAGGTGPNVLASTNHGSDFYQTPNLARLAAEGMSFTSCYVHQNCAPTRAALISGQYPARSGNGVYNVTNLNRGDGSATLTGPAQREDIPASSITYAERLQAAGYVTAHFGKYHVGNKDGGQSTMPENQGYDFNFGGKEDGAPGSYRANGTVFNARVGPGLNAWAANYDQAYIDDVLTGPAADPLHQRAGTPNDPSALGGQAKQVTDAIGDAFIAYVNDHRQGVLQDTPFFAQVHTYAVHTPIQSRPDLQSKYAGLPDGVVHGSNGYAGLLEGLDQTVGRILDHLKDPNRDGDFSDSIVSNTVVLFTSDNGGHEGDTDNAPLRNRKGSFYDGGLRVPLIVRYPGNIAPGASNDTLIHAVDFYPTLLEFAAGSIPDEAKHKLDGFSFAGHAMDPANVLRDRAPIFYHFPGYLDNRARPCTVCIRRVDGVDYKLIYNYDFIYQGNSPRSDAMPLLTQPWEMYCLNEDLSEETNLIDGSFSNWLLFGKVADEMAAAMVAWLNQPGADWSPAQVRDGGALVPFLPADVPDVNGESFVIVERAFDVNTGSRTLRWRSEEGFLYEIQGSEDLENWQVLVTDIPAGADQTGITEVGVEVLRATRAYYRVRLYRDFP